MLRVCVIDFEGNWDTHLPLAELSYNNIITPALRLPHLKHYTVENVAHHSVGQRFVTCN
jgi:hypothetical protein